MYRFGPAPPYSADLAGRQTQAAISLSPGQFYTFLLRDSGNNGIGVTDGTAAGFVRFRLHLLKNPLTATWGLGGSDEDDENAMMLLEGDGIFADEASFFFFVPRIYEDSTTDRLVTMSNSAPVFLTIHFDDWSHETSWLVVDAKNEDVVYANVTKGTYQNSTDITEEIELPLGRSYTLIMRDEFGDGIMNPNGYKLWMFANNKNNENTNNGVNARDGSRNKMVTLVDGSGEFGLTSSHNFTLASAGYDR
jgi:hypothetical protein